MRTKYSILVVATVTALMSLAPPAYAVTPDECTGKLDGKLEDKGKNRVCIFPASPEECKAKFDGLPSGDETECVVRIQ